MFTVPLMPSASAKYPALRRLLQALLRFFVTRRLAFLSSFSLLLALSSLGIRCAFADDRYAVTWSDPL